MSKDESEKAGAGSEQQPRTIEDEKWRKWSQLLARVWTDEKLKGRLMETPATVLREYGVEVPAGMQVRVVENTNDVFHLILPAKPEADVTELTSSQLRSVAGGLLADSQDCMVFEVEVSHPKSQCYSTCVMSR